MSLSRWLLPPLLVLLCCTQITGISQETRPAQMSTLSFNTILNLSNDTSSSGFPTMTSSGSNVYVAWLNNSLGNSNILFRASSNNGSSFGPSVKINNSTANGDSVNQEIAAVGTDVYFVWQQNVSLTNNNILFRASTNSGASFGQIVTVMSSGTSCGGGCTIANSVAPQIAAVGNDVYIVWLSTTSKGANEILFKASTSNGSNLASVSALTISSLAYGSAQPQVAAVTNFVYLTWSDFSPGRAQTFFAASSNSGTSFAYVAAHTLTSTLAGETDLYQQIAATGASVYVTWTNDTLAADNTMIAASTNNGATFGTALDLNKRVVTDLNPQLAASGSDIYVVWSDAPGNGNTEVLYRASTNNGATFGSILNMSQVAGFSNQQTISASGNNVYAAWVQSSTSTDGTRFVSSSDNGSTFTNSTSIVKDTLSSGPVVSGTGSYAYVVWEDDSTGNGDIYFARGNPAPPPTVASESFGTNENGTRTLTLSGSDPSGLPLTFSIVTGPSHGSLGPVISTGANSAQVTYAPNPGYTGSDSFTIKATDGTQTSSNGSISLIVYMSSASGGGGGGSRPFAK